MWGFLVWVGVAGEHNGAFDGDLAGFLVVGGFLVGREWSLGRLLLVFLLWWGC